MIFILLLVFHFVFCVFKISTSFIICFAFIHSFYCIFRETFLFYILVSFCKSIFFSNIIYTTCWPRKTLRVMTRLDNVVKCNKSSAQKRVVSRCVLIIWTSSERMDESRMFIIVRPTSVLMMRSDLMIMCFDFLLIPYSYCKFLRELWSSLVIQPVK